VRPTDPFLRDGGFQKSEALIKYSMDYLATGTLAFIKANPGWATLVIGLTAFAESFVFLSLLFPGTVILIASGALISEGLLDLISPIMAGIVGAVLGDAVSFWLGQKFGPFFSKDLAIQEPSRAPYVRYSIFRELWRKQHFHRSILRSFTRGGALGGRHDAHACVALLPRQRSVRSGLGASARLFR
jgi:hypothetical protein